MVEFESFSFYHFSVTEDFDSSFSTDVINNINFPPADTMHLFIVCKQYISRVRQVCVILKFTRSCVLALRANPGSALHLISA